ncbi:uncharacterized protein LOC116201857 [Punica granatum]|uniref:Phospholipase A2 domain-containing protein n=2 Tax=Punica granatum TaxID=22663 RepID=A0A218WMT3_PUNGR|nr:uncharacterized protein LOC116201857 [Punica granatum]XP_031389151.1 uncharacterized protein LOC116201857 [Punica granatum]OWM73541.1 hypothetical protein CDL15_Pgr026640 [Punica granatum]PKI77200.1 hypothetical protein CRG98_002410 [Punica granatum]
MNFEFLNNIPWFRAQPNNNAGSNFGSTTLVIEQPVRKSRFDIRLWGWSVLSVVPWAVRGRERIRAPTTINRRLKRKADSRGAVQRSTSTTPLRFRPYVSKVPWHTGVRGFLSQLFPRYGHYCGPNWSSGKNGGSPIWDQRPIDWLDYCCYCHDIGYDTHDQAKLLEADLAFLECLERPNFATKGDAHVAHIYKTMCITGLRNLLIPYRMQLLKLSSRQWPLIDFGWLSNVRWKGWSAQKT